MCEIKCYVLIFYDSSTSTSTIRTAYRKNRSKHNSTIETAFFYLIACFARTYAHFVTPDSIVSKMSFGREQICSKAPMETTWMISFAPLA